MLSPDGKSIWKSPAGARLFAAILGSKPMDDADRETVKKLMAGSQEADEPAAEPGVDES